MKRSEKPRPMDAVAAQTAARRTLGNAKLNELPRGVLLRTSVCAPSAACRLCKEGIRRTSAHWYSDATGHTQVFTHHVPGEGFKACEEQTAIPLEFPLSPQEPPAP